MQTPLVHSCALALSMNPTDACAMEIERTNNRTVIGFMALSSLCLHWSLVKKKLKHYLKNRGKSSASVRHRTAGIKIFNGTGFCFREWGKRYRAIFRFLFRFILGHGENAKHSKWTQSETFSFFLNDSRVDFEAHQIFVVGLQCPVHDELDFRVDFKDLKGVSIDVGLALQQRTRHLVFAGLVVHVVAGAGSVNSDERKGKA